MVSVLVDIQGVVDVYVSMLQSAVPVALVFALGDLIVCTFLRTALGGRLTLRSF